MKETIEEKIARYIKKHAWIFLVLVPINILLLSTDPVEGKLIIIAMVNGAFLTMILSIVIASGIADDYFDRDDDDDDDGDDDLPDQGDDTERKIHPEIYSR
jgi:hypothetical protein